MIPTRLGLFARTALALLVPFLLLEALVVTAFVGQVNLPLARRATEDLAAVIVLVAKTWVELPPETRPSFQGELAARHALRLAPAEGPTPGVETQLPYLALLQQALTRRIGYETDLHRSLDPEMYWVDLSMPGEILRIGFTRDRIGVQPSRVLLVALAGVVLASVLTALLLARWLTRPLARLSGAAVKVGQGEIPDPLPETGARELASLARRFNRMARDSHELLQGRTALLAGISHDLRTPLARLRLALAMLPKSVDPTLMADIERDIDDIDRLIGQHLDFARTMEPETPVMHDLREIVEDAVNKVRRQGAEIKCQARKPCRCPIAVNSLRRVLTNLLDNAWRHGGGTVEVRLDCGANRIAIEILDRGRGIGADDTEQLFVPFQRGRDVLAGGSGLGLAIVRELARRNDWSVTLHPREDGGTRARVEIHGAYIGGDTDLARPV